MRQAKAVLRVLVALRKTFSSLFFLHVQIEINLCLAMKQCTKRKHALRRERVCFVRELLTDRPLGRGWRAAPTLVTAALFGKGPKQPRTGDLPGQHCLYTQAAEARAGGSHSEHPAPRDSGSKLPALPLTPASLVWCWSQFSAHLSVWCSGFLLRPLSSSCCICREFRRIPLFF